MELISKVVDPLNHFWVEKYNEKAKHFFLNLGFEEVKYAGFKPTFNLEFKGSGLFGSWSDEEKEKIFTALNEINPEHAVKELNWDGEVYEQNPFE